MLLRACLPACLPAFLPARLPACSYDLVAEAFGGEGFYVTTPEELEAAMPIALASANTTVVNVMIKPNSQRKAQEFGWLTRAGDTEEAPADENGQAKAKL